MREVLELPLPNAPRPIAFSVLRVPFFLEPDYDEDKTYIETNRDRLIQKWGGRAGWERQKASHDLRGRGVEAGIPYFNLDRLASNTMASHRLIQHVGKRYGLSVSEGLYDRLNVYYFVEGHSLNDRDKLAQVAHDTINELLTKTENNDDDDDDDFVTNQHKIVMTQSEIFDFLNGNEGRAEIMKALHTLYDLGVHGIPKFIIEGQTIVDGAARSDTFIHIFREIEQRGSVANGPYFGNILGVSDDIVQKGSHTRQNINSLIL
jgi:predicted DsbA family dithiol-disulfide isomerase